MLELIALVGVGAAGLGGMWLKTRRRTNHGNTKAAVDKFDDAANRVSSAQARWYDLQIEAPIVSGGLDEKDRGRIERAENVARVSAQKLYEAWLPVSDVDGDAVASFNDDSRQTVSDHKRKALAVVNVFERDLDVLEKLLDKHRS